MRSGFICSRGFKLSVLTGAAICVLAFSVNSAQEDPRPPTPISICSEGMVYVPAGPFWMGCNKALDPLCEPDEEPYHEVYLDAYCIDEREVTVEEYEKCVNAGKCRRTVMGGDCNFARKDRRGHPVNCVNLKKAEMFCEWKGKRLPTEAEWEKAARGLDGRVYPWGNVTATCGHTVMMEEEEEEKGCGKGSTWPVGSHPQDISPYGVKDMGGNVSEWVFDRYDPRYYAHSPKENPRGSYRANMNVLRGGNWKGQGPRLFRASDRNLMLRIIWGPDRGIRCVEEAR